MLEENIQTRSLVIYRKCSGGRYPQCEALLVTPDPLKKSGVQLTNGPWPSHAPEPPNQTLEGIWKAHVPESDPLADIFLPMYDKGDVNIYRTTHH